MARDFHKINTFGLFKRTDTGCALYKYVHRIKKSIGAVKMFTRVSAKMNVLIHLIDLRPIQVYLF